jgi:hypothetical protein
MKPLIIATACMIVATTGFAQTDSTKASDTIHVGNFVIIKKNKEGNTNTYKNDDKSININVYTNGHQNKKLHNISTNWFIMDIGFTNLVDNTNYAAAQTMGYLKTPNAAAGPVTQNSMTLNSGKSSNVNIWFFMQKLNVSNHVLNLKYGMGYEMYNFRYDRSISYRSTPQAMVFNDSIGFSKDKLFAGYITVPFMININPTPHKHHGLSFSVGVSAGYLVDWRNKQISGERGKQKYRGDMQLQPWRLATIAEIGLGPVRLYGSYSFNTLHRDNTGLNQTPYAVGIRFSNW